MSGHPSPKRLTAVLAVVVIAVAFALRLLAEAFGVPSSSMEPTLLPGDHILVARYLFSAPDHGDVVVFENDVGRSLVKRVIGLPGDSVRIGDGFVQVNGVDLAAPAEVVIPPDEDAAVYVVPRDHLFLLGDNRAASSDSRTFGFVRRDAVVGHAVLVYWSVERTPEGSQIRWRRLLRSID